ncbi:YitT family protein [Bacillus andreraoultii]|uniref:YitT family protein n=1 Tax=Bacillus andreraoultii TaxID=1499685 RepID=UPI0005A5E5FE|nr:YitT family protein [Bacillus andreraoultii]
MEFFRVLYRQIILYVLLFFGAIIQGLAMALFLFPHSIPSGGGAGLAILLNYFFHLPLGFSLWIANAIFLIFALNYFGFTWTIKTILSVATTSLTVTLITENVYLTHIHISIDILLGSMIYGIGVGTLLRVGSSSGGMVIPSLMIARPHNWNPGIVMFWINLCIFLLTSLVIDYKIILFAVLCQFVSTRVIDYIYLFEFPRFPYFSLSWRKK